MPWFAFGYPLLAHLGVWLHNPHLQWLALVCLLASGLWDALGRTRAWAWSALALGAALLYWLSSLGGGLYVLYIPPALIPFALLLLFAGSLRAGATPMIARFAEAMRGSPLPPELKAYTRNVTKLWCAVSLALLISAVSTAVLATPEIWSLVTNVIHYVVLGAVFLFEFVYRRLKYGHLEAGGFADYLRKLVRIRLGK